LKIEPGINDGQIIRVAGGGEDGEKMDHLAIFMLKYA